MTDFATRFRNAVEAWLNVTGTAPARLGTEALGDPSFVLRLRQGRIPTLATADRVLVHIGEAPLGPAFRAEVEAFLEVTRTKPHIFGQEAVGDPSFVLRLRKGASPRLVTVDRGRRWMAVRLTGPERADIEAAIARRVAQANGHDRGGDADVNDHTERPMEYLGTREAAAALGLSPRTLDRYRVTGEGPAFHKFGTRVRYARADVEEWAAERRRTSTSDDGGDNGPNGGPSGRRTP